jgi:CRISPR-associated protein Cmr1
MTTAEALTVTLETVTPLFLAGAEPRGAPELRPPAFRGALRYWLRAALGGVLGDDIAAVRKAEAAVFGSTDAAGPVTIRIHHDSLPKPASFPKLGRPPSGRDYLYWSMAESGRAERGNYLGPKQYWPAKSVFNLILSPRPGAPNASDTLDRAAAALWLLLQLGGVGSRARRTGGSLAAREPVEAYGLRFRLSGPDPAMVADDLATGLRRVRAICAGAAEGPPSPAITAPASFDILHSATCRVWVLGVWPSADTAVEKLGGLLRDVRAKLPLHERAIYGLPMQRIGTKAVDRRASPLWLTVTSAGGQYAGIATLFYSTFLPPAVRITVNGSDYPTPANYAAVESALSEWIGRARGAREVHFA